MAKASRCSSCHASTSTDSHSVFELTKLPDEIASLVVDFMPLRSAARLAIVRLAHTDTGAPGGPLVDLYARAAPTAVPSLFSALLPALPSPSPPSPPLPLPPSAPFPTHLPPRRASSHALVHAQAHADWAERVQRSLRRAGPWERSYNMHRCCHDLTRDARETLSVPDDRWGWRDHLRVLEAVAVRTHPAELVWLIESLVGSSWWEPKYFDEEAVGRAVSRCLVGRSLPASPSSRRLEAAQCSADIALQLYGIFASRRNPSGCVTHCVTGAAAIVGAHTKECGGFCADNELATRAWSLRALTKPLGVCDADAVGQCLARSRLAAEHAAFFLLNYVGSVWEMWDFTPQDARALGHLAAQLCLDGSTAAAMIGRLAEEEAAHEIETFVAPVPGDVVAAAKGERDGDRAVDTDGGVGADATLQPASFACTCALLRSWAGAADFPAAWSGPERARVLSSVSTQCMQLPGFGAAVRPVVKAWEIPDSVLSMLGL